MRKLETLYRQLAISQKNEANAVTRLRRAQSIFDKHYTRTLALQRQITSINAHAANVANRLLGDNNDN